MSILQPGFASDSDCRRISKCDPPAALTASRINALPGRSGYNRQTTRSIRLTVALCFFGRSGPFSHASPEILEIVAHLFKRKSKCEEALRLVARKAERKTVAAECGNFGGIGIESNFNILERRWRPTRLKRSPTCA